MGADFLVVEKALIFTTDSRSFLWKLA